ncbi:MAG: hypothetical protein H7Z19_15345 [Chitinophagaceae bacterium]|nr:hypothetical protein [Rubrivivax sp.]
MTNTGLHKLIWVLVYTGLLTLSLGIFMQPRDNTLGWAAIVIGTLSAGIGVLLVLVRARRSD